MTFGVFGCLCFAHDQRAKGNKFAPWSQKCGYLYDKKGWKLYNLETIEIFVPHDVRFYENEFPYAEPSTFVSTDKNVVNVNVILDDLESTFEEVVPPNDVALVDVALIDEITESTRVVNNIRVVEDESSVVLWVKLLITQPQPLSHQQCYTMKTSK